VGLRPESKPTIDLDQSEQYGTQKQARALLQHNGPVSERPEMGKKRRFDRGPVTSGLPLSTDIIRAGQHVSNVPAAEVSSPSVPHHALAGVACGDAGEFVFEGGRRRPAVHPFHFN
jgi:hypothetical protein